MFLIFPLPLTKFLSRPHFFWVISSYRSKEIKVTWILNRIQELLTEDLAVRVMEEEVYIIFQLD